MKMRTPRSLSLLFCALSLLSLAGCGAGGATDAQMARGLTANGNQAGSVKKADGREVAVGEKFTLVPEEKVSVKDENLTVQLKSVRRTWYVDGKSETADADIIITLDGKEQRQWIKVGEKATVGAYTVELSGADPFGKTSAGLIVTERKALLFLSPRSRPASQA